MLLSSRPLESDRQAVNSLSGPVSFHAYIQRFTRPQHGHTLVHSRGALLCAFGHLLEQLAIVEAQVPRFLCSGGDEPHQILC